VWQATIPSRRLASRVEALEDVWVCWQCEGREDVSRIKDLSVGGLFLETALLRVALGSMAKIEFLVQEGQIRAECVLRRLEGRRGAGFKFTAIREEDRSRLATLMTRLRSLKREQREL
jgi:hypothetical protein